MKYFHTLSVMTLVLLLALAAFGILNADQEHAGPQSLSSAAGQQTRAPTDLVIVSNGTETGANAFGASALDIADINGDGKRELMVGCPGNDSYASDAGAAFVFLGGAGLAPGNLRPQDADFVIYGLGLEDEFGKSIENIGYFDNDGDEDYAISAPGANSKGAVFLFSSSLLDTSYPAKSFINYTSADLRLNGTYVDSRFGASVCGMDLNNDAYSDVAIGCPGNASGKGSVEIFQGGPITGKYDNGSEYFILGVDATGAFGTDIASVGDVDGDGFDDILVGAPLADRAYIFLNRYMTRANLWDNNTDMICDFTGSINQTGNTWGIAGADDGWDSAPTNPDVYGGVATQVSYNPAVPIHDLEIVLGGQIASGAVCSGAYGVEFNISAANYSSMSKAYVEFDYRWADNQGYENDERIWLKSRLGNGGGMTYLGSDLDSSGTGPDPENEIFTRVGNSVPASGTGHFKVDVTPIFTGFGDYYLEVGGKITKWTTATEYLTVGFDNITLYYLSKTGTDHIQINGSASSMLGMSMVGLGDINADGKGDFAIGAPSAHSAYLFYGKTWAAGTVLNASADADVVLSSATADDFGFCVDSARNMGGTSASDLVVSRISHASHVFDEGSLSVFFTSAAMPSTLTPADAGYAFEGQDRDGHLGIFARGVGDVTGDGKPDIYCNSQYFPAGDGLGDFFNSTTKGQAWLLSDVNKIPMITINQPQTGANLSGIVTINATCHDLDGNIPAGVAFSYSNDSVNWVYIGTNSTPVGPYYHVAWDLSFIPNGLYWIRANATDDKGAYNESVVAGITLFSAPRPIVEPIYPMHQQTVTGKQDFKVRVTMFATMAPRGVSFYLSQDNKTWAFIGNTTKAKAATAGVYNITFDSTVYEDGLYYFFMNVTDIIGTEGNCTVKNVTIINEYSPQIKFVFPTGGEVLCGRLPIIMNVSDRDNNLDANGVKLYIGRKGQGWTEVNSALAPNYANNTLYAVYLNTTKKENANDYGFWAHVADLTLRVSDVYTPYNITILNVYPPTITLQSPDDPTSLTGTVALTAQVVDSDKNLGTKGVTFSYSPDKSAWTTIASQGFPVDAGASPLVYTTNWDVSSVANGNYWLKANVTDLTDQYDEDILAVQITIDNQHAPQVTLVYPNSTVTMNGTVTLKAWAYDQDGNIGLQGVRLFYAKPSGSPVWTPIANVTAHDAGNFYSYDWNTKVVPDGNYIMMANVTDLTGLKDQDELEVTFKLSNGGTVVDDDVTDDDVVDDDTGDGGLTGFLTDFWWVLVIAVVLLVILIVVIAVLVKRNKKKKEEEEARRKKEDDVKQLRQGIEQEIEKWQTMKVAGSGAPAQGYAPQAPAQTSAWQPQQQPSYQQQAPVYSGTENINIYGVGAEAPIESFAAERPAGEPVKEGESDILSSPRDEDDIEITEDDLKIDITQEELGIEESPEPLGAPVKTPPAKKPPAKEAPTQKAKPRAPPRPSLPLDEVDEDEIDIEDKPNIKVR